MKVGSLVECIKDDWIVNSRAILFPKKGIVYTVTGFSKFKGKTGIYISEINNPLAEWENGILPAAFEISNFREILPPMEISIENILEKELV